MARFIGIIVVIALLSAATALGCLLLFVRITNNRFHDQELAEWQRRERPYRENEHDLERLA